MSGGGSKPGERRGGRQKGTPNVASARRQEQVQSTGKTPLDVLLEAMRFLFAQAALEQGKGDAADISKVRRNLIDAANIARDVAPFVHPKLASTILKGPEDGPVIHRLQVEFI